MSCQATTSSPSHTGGCRQPALRFPQRLLLGPEAGFAPQRNDGRTPPRGGVLAAVCAQIKAPRRASGTASKPCHGRCVSALHPRPRPLPHEHLSFHSRTCPRFDLTSLGLPYCHNKPPPPLCLSPLSLSGAFPLAPLVLRRPTGSDGFACRQPAPPITPCRICAAFCACCVSITGPSAARCMPCRSPHPLRFRPSYRFFHLALRACRHRLPARRHRSGRQLRVR